MGKYVTVSAKIPLELRKKLREFNIKPSPIIRKALEHAVKRAALKRLEKKAAKLSKRLKHISDEEIAQIIREERDRH